MQYEMAGIGSGKRLVDFYTEADTEANARAKMWLYLKENNLLKESE